MSAAIAEATEDQPAARAALAAAVASPFTPTCSRAARLRQGGAARALAAELLAAGAARPRGRPAAGARRSSPHPDLAWLRPPGTQHLVEDVRERVIAPGRLPPVRGRAAGVRDRGRRRDGRGEPERAAEDARGAAAVRPSDPGQRRARGAARDGALALPRGALRAARPEAVEARLEGAGSRRRAARPPRGSAAATWGRAASCSSRGGPRAAGRGRGAGPGRAPRRARRRALGRRWRAPPTPPASARRRGPRAGRRARPRRMRPSAAAPAAPPAQPRGRGGWRSAPRGAPATRPSTSAWDCSAAWMRDLAAVAEGAPRAGPERRSRAPSSAELGEGLDPRRARRAGELVMETRRRLQVNVSEALALEALAFRLEYLLEPR